MKNETILISKSINNYNFDDVPSIELSNFYFRYEKDSPTVLNDINLKIFRGETIFIGGISGSGKTTLLNAISGQIPHKIKGQMKGTVRFLSKDIWSYNTEELSLNVGYIFQNADSQLISFTVFDEIAFAAENLCLPIKEIKERISDIANALGINHLLERSIFSLSGGEKQKVILAANLVTNPKVLILDEPLAFLDLFGEKNLINLLKSIKKQNEELIIIIVEHRLTPFQELIDNIILLDELGSIDFFGNISEYNNFINNKDMLYLRDMGKFKDYKELLDSHKTEINDKVKNIIKRDEILVKIKNLSYKYSDSSYIFENFSMNINRGEFLGIVGENGCGKTTLLYLLAKILHPSQGNLIFENNNYEEIHRGDFYKKIGFIFQNPESQIFETTVGSEILFGPKNLLDNTITKNDEWENQILNEYLPLVNGGKITNNELKSRNPFKLSWGQKRRLNLASIFSYDADLLLIDEPFIGQDAVSVQKIFDILHQFNQMGKTIVIVSHDVDLLSSNCSRLFYLDKYETNNANTNTVLKTSEKKNKDKYKTTKGSHTSRKEKELKKLVNSFVNEPEDSWLSRLNPLIKLFGLLFITIVLFFQTSIIFLTTFFGSLFLIGKTAKIKPNLLFKKAKWIFIVTLLYIPLNTLFDAGYSQNDIILFYLFGISVLPIRRLALYYALKTGLLIVSLFTMAVLFNQTTSLKKLVYSLIQIGLPYRYAFSFIIGLRYIPIIQNESYTIEIAQRLRGFGVKKGSSVKKIYQHILYRITTLLVNIFRKSYTTSLAIEIRCFGAYPKRTNLFHVEWRKIDFIWLIMLCIIGILGVFFGFNYFPGLNFPSIYSLLKFYNFFI
ncbi:MAG: ATP-binding cassette domain-containing protein [archaeon]|nr:ATP-binding cassette domain-containing protein [archaeon]